MMVILSSLMDALSAGFNVRGNVVIVLREYVKNVLVSINWINLTIVFHCVEME